MPEESQKDLFRDLEFKIDNATDVLFYKLDDIFKQLETNAEDDKARFIESTSNQNVLGIQTYITQVNDTLNLLDSSIIRIGTKIDNSIMAISARNSEVTEDIIKTAIDDSSLKEDYIGQISNIASVEDRTSDKASSLINSTQLDVVEEKNRNEATETIPAAKITETSDGGLYFDIRKISDSVDKISNNLEVLSGIDFNNIPSENIKEVSLGAEREDQSTYQDVVDIDWLIGFGNSVSDSLSSIELHASAIQKSFLGFVEYIDNAVLADNHPKDQVDDRIQSVQYENAIDQLPIYDYTYQDKILNVLSSPVQVKLIDSKISEDVRREDTVDVFSNAVRPLVDGEISLQKTLDSNLRRLTEAISTLREIPRESEDRVTRITDSLNTEMSDDSVRMILNETRTISGLLSDIHIDISSLYNAYRENNKEENSRGIETPTVVDMN